ncbi:MAG: hypothetical protein FJ119_10780 [Deltaproteobacteria bacterium]|nr:hypothetical protein [Deltaproteobacteria bacterium]
MKKTLKCEICGQQKPRAEITRCENSITKRGQTCSECMAELSAATHCFWSGEHGDYESARE